MSGCRFLIQSCTKQYVLNDGNTKTTIYLPAKHNANRKPKLQIIPIDKKLCAELLKFAALVSAGFWFSGHPEMRLSFIVAHQYAVLLTPTLGIASNENK